MISGCGEPGYNCGSRRNSFHARYRHSCAQWLTTDGLLGRRYLARFVDSMITLVLIFVVEAPVVGILGLQDATDLRIRLTLMPLVLTVCIGYGAVLESSQWQATLGKRLCRLRVYDTKGGRLTMMQAGGRNLVKDGPFIVFGSIPGGQLLAFVWLCAHLVVMHRSSVYQAIHDRAAHTWVAAPEETTQLHLA